MLGTGLCQRRVPVPGKFPKETLVSHRLLFVLSLSLSVVPNTLAVAAARPNIIVILSDDMAIPTSAATAAKWPLRHSTGWPPVVSGSLSSTTPVVAVRREPA